MENDGAPTSNEIGRSLARIRENAGLKQGELAKQTTISPAVLSRIENGERNVDMEEVAHILRSIGTDEAENFTTVIKREWKVIPRPPLDHPDQNLLWEAEITSVRLESLKSASDTKAAFVTRLTEYLREIRRNSDLLINTDHQVAFVGSIGIGKTTAICKIAGLEVKTPDDRFLPVLEAGAGGITICEVHLKNGPEFGIFIEPRNEEEIRQLVFEFTESLMQNSQDNATSDESDADKQIISKEVERAIRNMANLRRRKEKNKEGKFIRIDDARLLASEYSDARSLAMEIMSRMNLHKRDMRNVWYDAGYNGDPLLWLKETFEQINNGRHQSFTIPKRIEIFTPQKIVKGSEYIGNIIDTKGIDRTAARSDLEYLLDDPHTLTVLCSGFNNAPATELRLLLERARDNNVPDLNLRSVILVLPRPEEAEAVKDESGVLVDSVEEGYELKREQIELSLFNTNKSIGIEFYNSRVEEPHRISDFINEKIYVIRQTFRSRLQSSITNSINVIENHEKEQIKEVIRQVEKLFDSWIRNNRKLSDKRINIEYSLLKQISTSPASSIHASIRREGEWYNLSYAHHLGYGTRRAAVDLLTKKVTGFSELCKTLSSTDDYTDANQIITQAEVILSSAYDELLKKVQVLGRNAYSSPLKSDSDFWHLCASEWGSGSGYRDRIVAHNEEWFNREENRDTEMALINIIEREWGNILDRVRSIFGLKDQ